MSPLDVHQADERPTNHDAAKRLIFHKSVTGRSRTLSDHWKVILAGMAAEHPRFLTYHQIEFLADLAGQNFDRRTIRSQMSLYKDRGLVETEADGQFRVTEKGAAAAGVGLGRQQKSETPPVLTEGVSDGTVRGPFPSQEPSDERQPPEPAAPG